MKTSYSKIFALLILVFIVLGVILNIRALYNESIRLDESQSIWFSSKPVGDVLRISSEDVHVPLYYVLLHYWIQFFGSSVNAVRTLSLIFFVATLPVIYKLAKESADIKTAALAVLLFSSSPFVVWFSTEARMYTLFIFVTSLNALYFQRFVKSKGNVGSFGLFVTSFLGLYTHYFYNLVIATQIIYISFLFIRQYFTKHNNKYSLRGLWNNRKVLFSFLRVLFWSYLTFLPWIVYFYSQGFGEYSRPSIPQPTSYTIVETFSSFIFGFQSYDLQGLYVSLWPIITIFLFLLFSSKRKIFDKNHAYFLLLSFVPIVLAYVVSSFRPIFLPRYFIFISPALFFLLSVVFVRITDRAYSWWSIVFLIIMFAFLSYQNFSPLSSKKEDFNEVAKYLEETAEVKDVIAVTPPFTAYPIEYYYNGDASIKTIPEWNRYQAGPIPEFVTEEFIKNISEYKNRYSRIFVVLSYDQGYEEEILTFLDNNFQLVDEKKISFDLSVRTYRLRYDDWSLN